MRVFVGQIYIKPGVSFPFSHRFQVWLGEEISSIVQPSGQFCKNFGAEFNLIFNVSADISITDNVIKGPTVFRKDKDVEYTVFLPYDVISGSHDRNRVALEYLLTGIITVFKQIGIDAAKIAEKKDKIIEAICLDAEMFKSGKV